MFWGDGYNVVHIQTALFSASLNFFSCVSVSDVIVSSAGLMGVVVSATLPARFMHCSLPLIFANITSQM